MSLLETYLLDKRRALAHDYKADCLTIAREIAGLLAAQGKQPFIACLHKEELRAAGRFHYPLTPKAYGGRVTWTRHYVCCCEGMVYDPILEETVEIERYSRLVFGKEFPLEIFIDK